MGMYSLWEISLRNYDSALGALPFRHYHNSFVIFPVARTSPCINNYVKGSWTASECSHQPPTIITKLYVNHYHAKDVVEQSVRGGYQEEACGAGAQLVSQIQYVQQVLNDWCEITYNICKCTKWQWVWTTLDSSEAWSLRILGRGVGRLFALGSWN